MMRINGRFSDVDHSRRQSGGEVPKGNCGRVKNEGVTTPISFGVMEAEEIAAGVRVPSVIVDKKSGCLGKRKWTRNVFGLRESL